MPRITREVIEHKLGIDPAFKPIKQKERRYTPERHEAIQLEVNKLLEAGFIRPVDYPSWLANPILVEKPDRCWCMCIDYTSLNKVYPKDEYPLSRICQIVDFATSCELLSFLDAYSGLPLTMKKKQRSSRRFGFSVTLRWHLGSRTGELHISNVYTRSWKVRLGGTSSLH
jgi:hypothetical protein